MRVALRSWTSLVFLLPAALMASCAFPQAPPEKRAPLPVAAPAAASKLAPSNAVFPLEAEGLKLLWSQELGQLTSNRRLRGIYVAGRTVVAEVSDGEIHCLEAATGIWKATAILRGGLDRRPTEMGAQLFLVVGNDVFTYDMVADTLSRPYDPRFALFTSPLVYQGKLVLAGGNGHISEAVPGQLRRWLASLEGPIFESPVIVGDVLFASATGDQVIALDLGAGREMWRWRPKEPSDVSSGVAVYDGTLYVGDTGGFIHGLTTQYGEHVWKEMAEAPIVGKPEVVGSKVLVLTDAPSLVCVAAEGDRQVLWRYEGAEQVLTAGEDAVYVLRGGGTIAAVALETGEELWRDTLPSGCKVTADLARPVLYLADQQGSIAALAELDYYPAE